MKKVLSFQLADSGRMGVIQLNLIQPNLTESLIVNSTEKDGRIIMAETGSIGNLEPGKWNIIAATFKSNSLDFESIDIENNALTVKTILGIDIVPGYNPINLPLSLNYNYFTDWGTGDSTPVNVMQRYDGSIYSSNPDDTVIMVLTNFPVGESRIYYTPSDFISYPTDIRFYNEDGSILTPDTGTSGIYGFWSFNISSSTQRVIVTARKLDFETNSNQLRIEYGSDDPLGADDGNGLVNLISEPYSLFALTPYSGGA